MESKAPQTIQKCMGCGKGGADVRGVEYPLCSTCLPQYLAPVEDVDDVVIRPGWTTCAGDGMP